MINKICLSIIIFSFPLFLRADELVLKDGKTIQGKITGEDAREITMLLGSKMYIRVEKSKIVKVNRDPKPVERSIVHTMPVIKKSSAPATVPVTKSTAPAAVTVPAVSASSVTVTKTEAPKEVRVPKKDGVSIELANLPGEGPLSWQASWEGAIGKDDAQFKWKWAIVRATVTNVMDDALSKGKTAIYKDSLASFAEELRGLRASDEKKLRADTDQLFADMKENAEKKQKGFDRRQKKSFDVHKK